MIDRPPDAETVADDWRRGLRYTLAVWWAGDGPLRHPSKEGKTMTVRGGKRFKQAMREAQRQHAAMPKGVHVGSFGPPALDLIANEFGVPGQVAERPAFRQALSASLDTMRAETIRRARRGGINERDALAIGEILAKELRRSIEAFTEPPNRPWKPKSDPLVFTGALLESIGVEIIR